VSEPKAKPADDVPIALAIEDAGVVAAAEAHMKAALDSKNSIPAIIGVTVFSDKNAKQPTTRASSENDAKEKSGAIPPATAEAASVSTKPLENEVVSGFDQGKLPDVALPTSTESSFSRNCCLANLLRVLGV
jgi:hypothetical protein